MGKSKRGKQSFRARSTVEQGEPAAYPVFEVGRRRFLRQLGLVAGGSLGFVMIGCTLDDDHTSLGGKADSSFVPRDAGPPDTSGGIPDAPPAVADQQIDRFQAIDQVADGYPSQPDIVIRRPDLAATRPDLAGSSDAGDAGDTGPDGGSRP